MPRGNGIGGGMCRQMRGSGYGRGFAGNTGANCRFYPSLPRRWWAVGSSPVSAAPVYNAAAPSESEYLQEQARFLKNQLGEIEKRIEELGNKKTEQKE